MMNSRKQLANTIQQVNPLEMASHQLQQQHSQIQLQQQQQQYQFQQSGIQKNTDQLQQQIQQQQNQQLQGFKNNSLSMNTVVASINLSNGNHMNQIQNLQSQSILSPSNTSSAATSQANSVNQQLGSPQKYQQLNNKAFSLIKNNYFKSNSGLIQNNISIQLQQQISPPSGQLLSPNSQNQHQKSYQSQLNNSGSSATNLISNKKSPKLSTNSKNKGNSSSGLNSIHNQRENIQTNKDNENNNGTKNSDLTVMNQSSNQKSSNQLSKCIDKTTHLQNIDKIRNTLNNKLSIQTELNHVVVGGNSLNNLGLMNYQGSSNMFSHFPASTTSGSTSTTTFHQQQNSNQPYKKIVSITPQYSNCSKIKFFESQNKQHQDLTSSKKDGALHQTQQIATTSMQEISHSQQACSQAFNKIDDTEEESQKNIKYQIEYQDENCNQSINNIERNNDIRGNGEIYKKYGDNQTLDDYSKSSQPYHKQQDLENQNLALTLMNDKLKKRDKNPNSAKGYPRNSQQFGPTSNASYSKSSFPSNNSTTVNHYQSNSNNINFLNSNQNQSKNMQAVTSQTFQQPIQMISLNSNMQQNLFQNSIVSNSVNKNMVQPQTVNGVNINTYESQKTNNQISKALSFTLQQYHNLLNQDLNQLQSQQQSQQSLMKNANSQSTNQELCGSVSAAQFDYQMNFPQANNIQPLISQSNTNLQSVKSTAQTNQQQLNTNQKHRKVVSMSSSSPKFSKENMYIDCSKGSYNIVDVKKLFKGQSTATNSHLNSNNQGNSKGSKQLGSGDRGESNFCTPHGNSSQNKSTLNGDNTKPLQIKFSKTPGNMSFNHISNNNNHTNHNNENREGEKITHKNQDKSKNFLSKITNHQGKNSGLIDENSSKKSFSKKSHKSQSCSTVSSQINLQKSQSNVGMIKDENKKSDSQVMIQHPIDANFKNKNIYQSQTDFSLLKQHLIEQQQFVNQFTDKQQITNQLNQQQLLANQSTDKQYLINQLNEKQQHTGCDNITAVNSNAKNNKQSLGELDQHDSHEYILKLENARVESKIDQILKQRIDENSYSDIMDVFAQIIGSDIYFKSSLSKFKICLDSLMHDMNSKIKNLKVFTAKTQQLKKNVEAINNEKKQLQDQVSILQNENQQLLSNSTNVTNSNQSKTNNNINMPSDSGNNINVTRMNSGNIKSESIQNDENKNLNQCQHEQVNQYNKTFVKHSTVQKDLTFQEKQTQTVLKEIEPSEKFKQLKHQNVNQQIPKEEIDETTNEITILKGYVVEQEKKITAYKEKESSMIKLLLAIKKNGIDIDDIYEREVINKPKSRNQNNQNNDNDEEDDQDDGDDNFQQNGHIRSKFIENIQNGITDNNRNHSQSLGYADESIINDSDESSFNYYGKTSSLNDSMLSQFNPHPKEISNLNSGRSKIEDGLKWKLRLNLNDLKKMNTQPNDDQAVQQNLNNIDTNQQKVQVKQINDIQQHNPINNDIHNNNDPLNIQSQYQKYGKAKNIQNIFIESEYQECNFDKNKNKRIISQINQINLEEENNIIDQNGKYFDQDNQNMILQDYIFNPNIKISSNNIRDLNEYISQSDYQTHKVDSQMQSNFELEEDQLNDDDQQEESSAFLDNNQIDFQNELMKKLDDISLTWPDESKPVVF